MRHAPTGGGFDPSFLRTIATEIFGSIQGAVARSLLDARSGEPNVDALTGLPGPAHFDEWMRVLLAEQERHGHSFALAIIDADGLGRINDAYGRDAGDRLLVGHSVHRGKMAQRTRRAKRVILEDRFFSTSGEAAMLFR